jgi:ferredoxin/flavodoxin---NADP+ reductase
MAKHLEYNATLTGRIDLEPTLAIFRVKPDAITRRDGSTHGPWFVPGQYVTIGMNRAVVEGEDDPRPLSVRRPMSIASAPEDEDEVEFYIRYVNEPESDLPLTHVMWPIEEGARLYLRAVATGKFTLRDTVGEDDRRIKVMVAAGTGLAPFVSIARSRLRRDPSARLDDLAILHGASYPSSLGYREELEAMARDHGLRYLPTVSRPRESDAWTGATGRVEALFEPSRLADTEARLGLPSGALCPDEAVVLICGLQGTIANTILHLNSRGYVPDNRRLRRALEIDDGVPATIFWEQYDTTPVLDVKDEALMKRLREELHAARR